VDPSDEHCPGESVDVSLVDVMIVFIVFWTKAGELPDASQDYVKNQHWKPDLRPNF
jgi:hypothetical protein